MTRAAIYTRSSKGGFDRQRDELHAKFGVTHEIVAEYQDNGPGSSALKKLLADAAKGKFDVLLCTEFARLTRHLTPEIITALRDAGVKVVTADRGEIGVSDLVANTLTTTRTESGDIVSRKRSRRPDGLSISRRPEQHKKGA